MQLPLGLPQSPASAPGLEQSTVLGTPSPVQKHDASSNVMHVSAAQYGYSDERVGRREEPSGGQGMHTSQSN